MAPPVLWPWQGGKARLAAGIASRLPSHRAYVEPFAGTAAVFLAKARSPIEVLNDANGDIIAVYRCLQDPVTMRHLVRRLRWTPISRAEWRRAKDSAPIGDTVEQAARFLIRLTQGFGGKPDSSSWGGGMASDIQSRVDRLLHRLPVVADRLRGVALESGDWSDVATRYDRVDTVCYLDPPYVGTDGDYGMAWTLADQTHLVNTVLQMRSMVVLSGYEHPTTLALVDAGWHQETYRLPVGVKGRTEATGLARGRLAAQDYRTECLWWSPSAWAHANRQLAWF
ncbi:DNA adenine methylase [Sulfobacillus sp. hq2]|uniref:DNA adenine methylase n=1 Tax=Sulfobacillus TaxID=28033 RepID=UPI001FA90252|nr:DNA adenine methylase [Sulfobacillus sp. hq2]